MAVSHLLFCSCSWFPPLFFSASLFSSPAVVFSLSTHHITPSPLPQLFFFLCLLKIHPHSYLSVTPPYRYSTISFVIPLLLLQLHKVAVGRASDLLKVHGEQLPLRALKAGGAEGNLETVAEYSRTLTEQKEQLVEVGRGSREAVVPLCRSAQLVKKKSSRYSFFSFYLSEFFILEQNGRKNIVFILLQSCWNHIEMPELPASGRKHFFMQASTLRRSWMRM